MGNSLPDNERNFRDIDKGNHYRLEELDIFSRGFFLEYSGSPEISERKALLDWLEYNDDMYFEKTSMPDSPTQEEFRFQKYINMPIDELKRTVSAIKTPSRKVI
jgi:hypothetical protein